MRTRLKIGLISSFLTFALTTVNAQDVHFSQAIYSPLTLNPALAGLIAPITAILNYRTQWKSVASPYSTIAASYDMRINENRRQRRGILAFGINFLNDKAGDARISTTNANLNLAYHLIVDRKSTIGLGIYTGFGQRSIDAAAGRWGSQYDGNAYNPGLATGETFLSDQFSFMDVGAGFVYNFKNSERYMTSNDQKEFSFGGAVYHLSRPNYSFLSTNDERLFMRFSGFAHATIGISNTKLSLKPAVYYQRQRTAQELLIGTYFRYMAQEESRITGYNKGTFISLGAFYRNKDAFVVKGMVEWSDFTLGVAYDVNVSSLVNVSNARGGFEIFIKYGLSQALAQQTRSRI